MPGVGADRHPAVRGDLAAQPDAIGTLHTLIHYRRIPTAKARIQARIDRLALGLAGDVKPVGEGISELRIDYGPGYRVYFIRRGDTVVVLLAGGDKGTQDRDIATAFALARSL